MEHREELDLFAEAREYIRIRGANEIPNAKLVAAWGDFFQLVDPKVRRLVYATKTPNDQRDDVAQEVWVEIVEGLHGFQGEHAWQQFHCWIYQVVRTKAARVIRRLSTHPVRSLEGLSVEPEDCQGKAPADREEVVRVWELFQDWLNNLAKKETRNHLLMHGRYVEEHSLAELAEASGLSANAVSRRLNRLRERFRVWRSRRG